MIWVFGSINIDHFYRVDHLVAPGETLAALAYEKGLGGKGANQSVAAARAGAKVAHIGAIGPDGPWTLDTLRAFGVDTAHVIQTDTATGHAMIQVDTKGENSIVLYPGANQCLSIEIPAQAQPGDWLMLQNETNGSAEIAKAARRHGLHVAYSAAPFDAEAVAEVLPHIDLLLCNEIENAALIAAIGDIPTERIVTKGARGAEWIGTAKAPAFHVEQVVDTTGAGDCFAGYLIASLDAGLPRQQALNRAIVAGALQVMKKGTADAMPYASEVDAKL